MRKEKITIFDFDGVIANSFEIAFAINKISRPAITRERYRKLFDGNIYDAVLEDTAVSEVDFFPNTANGLRLWKLMVKSSRF